MAKKEEFRLLGYQSEWNERNRRPDVVITDIESLLKYLAKNTYYIYNLYATKPDDDRSIIGGSSDCRECEPEEDFSVWYREAFEGLESIYSWELETPPTEKSSLRIVRTACVWAVPQRACQVIFDDITDENLPQDIKTKANLYPYTVEEFLKLLCNRKVDGAKALNWKEYDFIGLKHI